MAWTMPAGAVLGIFARQPEPGRVKTRLGAAIGAYQAARAYEAMLLDVLDGWGSNQWLAPGGRRVVVFDPPGAGPWFDERVPAALGLQAQVEGDLGVRMAAFFAGEFEDGAEKVVLIGSDSPTLDPTLVISAFLCLEEKDVVLGPSTDGGYYLLGAKGRVPPIFEGVEWSGPGVLRRTVERLTAAGMSLAVLPPWYDVDEPTDWEVLVGHLKALRAAGMETGLRRLERLVEEGMGGLR